MKVACFHTNVMGSHVPPAEDDVESSNDPQDKEAEHDGDHHGCWAPVGWGHEAACDVHLAPLTGEAVSTQAAQVVLVAVDGLADPVKAAALFRVCLHSLVSCERVTKAQCYEGVDE